MRPSNVFGAEMTNQSIFNMISIIDRGLFFYIGSSPAIATYIHVNNVIEVLLRCAVDNHSKCRIYNLSDDCTLVDFVDAISGALKRPPPRFKIPRVIASLMAGVFGRIPGFPLTNGRINALRNRTKYSISKIQEELGYQHVVSTVDGLRDLVCHYKNRRNREMPLKRVTSSNQEQGQ